MKFPEFQKIARLNRDCTITEKVDGSNGLVFIIDYDKYLDSQLLLNECYILGRKDNLIMFAGSRTKWITPGKQTDNYGFAQWVKDNNEELFKLGEGHHYGEWAGLGIQRNYGLKEKRFFLFNINKWSDDSLRPKCCYAVPKLYEGLFDTNKIKEILEDLRTHGSYVVPFMNPEGICIYHTASRNLFKVTLEADEKPKSIKNNDISNTNN